MNIEYVMMLHYSRELETTDSPRKCYVCGKSISKKNYSGTIIKTYKEELFNDGDCYTCQECNSILKLSESNTVVNKPQLIAASNHSK